jgi:15-cis-phytoene synthase
MTAGNALEATLPVLQRLALSYAPAPARLPWLALLGLDAKLAAIVRSAREPMLAQVRLAWWRDLLGEPASAWPSGEPVLAALASWRGRHGLLAPVAEAWGDLSGEGPLDAGVFLALAEARAAACAGLADLLGVGHLAIETNRMARAAALADLSLGVSDPHERMVLAGLVQEQDWRRTRLPRVLRPLTVIHGLAARRKEAPGSGPADLLTAMRLGLLGR